ncbi:relaxase domain-containing protein [Stenotrophomonas acidaminiphila]|uniref:relaxase domain-containing protein n=1 Tax=Stenotrophomonas acidaminiphila TaxID=128780 RepID=UPI0024070857|nr:relaxase domain-containing protein [Stenotrophomonas acidaminiphila]
MSESMTRDRPSTTFKLACSRREDLLGDTFSFVELLGAPLAALRWGGSWLTQLQLDGPVTEEVMRRLAMGQDLDGQQRLWEGEDHHTCAAGYRVSLRLPDGFAALLDTDAEQRAGLQAAHRHAVDHTLSSLPFQRDHRVLYVASDRLEGEWTHHWLFAMACAPNGTWERLTQSLRQPASEAAYVHAMDALVKSARLDRLFRPAPAAPSRLRL